MNRRRLALAPSALLVALALSSGRAAAQVNAEALRPNPFKAGWSGGFDGSFAISRGNVNVLDAGGAARVQFETLHPTTPTAADPAPLPFIKHRAFLTVSARYADKSAATFISQAYVHARWSAMWHPRIGSDVFAQFQYNQFWRLQARGLVGAGLRAELVHLPAFLLWAGSAYMFEYNRIDVLPGASDAPETFEHRWTNYLAARLALFGGKLLAQNTLYVQPRFDDLGDFRLLDELEVLVKITDLFAFGATFSVLHDSAPPTGVEGTDIRMLTMVRVSL